MVTYHLGLRLKRAALVPLNFHLVGIHNNTITASMLSWYLIRKLEQRFTIKELFKPISRELRLLIKRYRC